MTDKTEMPEIIWVSKLLPSNKAGLQMCAIKRTRATTEQYILKSISDKRIADQIAKRSLCEDKRDKLLNEKLELRPATVKMGGVRIYGHQDDITCGWNNCLTHIALKFPNGIKIIDEFK